MRQIDNFVLLVIFVVRCIKYFFKQIFAIYLIRAIENNFLERSIKIVKKFFVQGEFEHRQCIVYTNGIKYSWNILVDLIFDHYLEQLYIPFS